jgi:hypothetical protein
MYLSENNKVCLWCVAGLNTGIAPMYLSEIAPTSLRGLCGTFNQLAICTGVMVAQILGLQSVLGTETWWPFVLGK